jgi:hypothetical protein
MSDFQSVLYEVRERIATITLNRPERLNAIDGSMPPLPLQLAGPGEDRGLLGEWPPVRPAEQPHHRRCRAR